MDINTNTETFKCPSYLNKDSHLLVTKTKTVCGADIVHLGDTFDVMYNDIPNRTNSFNIIDFQAISEFDMAEYARYAVNLLPKKENIIVGYPSEALNSTYWNVIFDILQTNGYKKILWIDGGLTSGQIFRHLHNLQIVHFHSPLFFKTLFRSMIIDGMPQPGDINNRSVYYLSLGRLVRQERIYFTKKLLENTELFNKGIVTCGWGDSTLRTWNDDNSKSYLNMMMEQKYIDKFPISLGHEDKNQHTFEEIFKTAIFNVVQESSIALDPRSHDMVYNPVPPFWQTVSSDRIFFTEKTAKAFLMNQIPLLIAAPGMVQVLRNLGFDMFDDIVNHNYDKEDNLFKRCDMVYDELNRLANQYTLSGWNALLRERKLSERFYNNHKNVKNVADNTSNKISNWVEENF